MCGLLRKLEPCIEPLGFCGPDRMTGPERRAMALPQLNIDLFRTETIGRRTTRRLS